MGRRRRPHAPAPRLLHPRRHRRPGPGPAPVGTDFQLSGPQYTFGDTDLARRRLELVAKVFEGPSKAFLGEHVDFRPELALDLGCGPGRTTQLIAEVTSSALVVGLDMSEPFLAVAPRAPKITYICADATETFPTVPPDLVYCRLLLAHLPDPTRVIDSWARQLLAGGLLLLDEVEWIDTPNPVLARYEEIVTAMVASRGAQISVGPTIAGLSGQGWRQRSSEVRKYPVATADAALMYSMNLATWRHDPFVVKSYDDAEIDQLAAGLDELTRSEATGEIDWALRQVAYERL